MKVNLLSALSLTRSRIVNCQGKLKVWKNGCQILTQKLQKDISQSVKDHFILLLIHIITNKNLCLQGIQNVWEESIIKRQKYLMMIIICVSKIFCDFV